VADRSHPAKSSAAVKRQTRAMDLQRNARRTV